MFWWNFLALDESIHQCVTGQSKPQFVYQKIYPQNTHSNLPRHAKISNFEEVSTTRAYLYCLGIYLQSITLILMEPCLGPKINLISNPTSKRSNFQRRKLSSLRWRYWCIVLNCLRPCTKLTLIFVYLDFHSSYTRSFEGICSSFD